jgi:hypothetical protein
MSKFLKSAAAAVLVMAASSSAHAQLSATGLDCDHNGALAFMGATACSGAWSGNINNQTTDVNAELAAAFGGTYTLLGYSNDTNNGPFSNGSAATSGTLNFDLPITGEFIIGLKAGNAFSFYQFIGQVNRTSIDFTTSGVQVNGNDIPAGLSHAALYVDPATSTVGTTAVVPEPSTYAMMIGGLFALGVAARRRRK